MTSRIEHLELVWDRGYGGTVVSGSQDTLRVGPEGEWTPMQLLMAAIESSVMSEFLRLAEMEELVVLGYVSAAEAAFDLYRSARPRIVVRPCVVLESPERARRARALLASAAEVSPVVRALGDTVRLEAEMITVTDATTG